jgi:hypothetical protein
MTDLPARIAALAQLSLQDPRAATRALLAMDVPLSARSLGLLLMAVLSAVLMQIGFLIMPPGVDPLANFFAASPFRTAAVQWLILVLSVLFIHRIGRIFGGRGNLADTLLIVVWMQCLMLFVQAVLLVVLLIAPPFAALLNLGGLVFFFWVMTGLVAELYGFTSRGAVLAVFLAASFAFAVVLVTVLALILGPEAFLNV